MARNTYDNARKQTIAYALAQGYTMIEDGCHMESPRGMCYHIDELMSALIRKGIVGGWY